MKAVAATPKADPLLYLTGGPGGTGIVTAQQRVAGGINADRDVIFIDQRGTYHSDPRLSCPEIDEFASKQYALDFFASATIIAGTAATEACRKRLTAQGYDLDSYNTAENAADVADLRVALGIKSWNIYGVSYGNDLALSVLRDHPEGIRSEVLDSVVPPQANLQEGFWAWPAEGYANLFAACAAQPACHTAYPHLSKEFFATVRKLTAKPLLVGLKLPSGETERVIVDGYALANAAVLPSLGPGLMTGLPAAIHAIANGDGRTIAEIVASQNPSGVIGWGLALGVLCGEQVAWTTPAQALASARKALPEFPISVLTPRVSQAPMLTNDCRVWNVPKLTPDPHRAVTSELPVLLMSGSLDAAAPPGNAKQVAAELSNSQSVVIPGSGHDVLLWDRRCSQPIMNAFLNDPTKTVDTTCAKNLPVPPFTTK